MTNSIKLGIGALLIIIIAGGTYWYTQMRPAPAATTVDTTAPVSGTTTDKTKTVIGKSAGGRDIIAYHFGLPVAPGAAAQAGEGTKELLFIGGIHGGYEWNTVLVAYELMDYLKANPTLVATGTRVTVIPVMNPDGLQKVVSTAERFTAAQVPVGEAATVPGRFNANEVDLNRNFDCDWQAQAKWQNKTVSGGSAAFSEPESKAVRDYVSAHKPTAALVWYSAAGGVFASNCHDGVLPETMALVTEYAKASGYSAFKNFDFYEITGDMVNWFAKEGIPAISVLLTDHKNTEWDKNKKGIDAILKRYAQ